MPDFKPWQWATLIGLLIAVNVVVIGGLILVIATYRLWADPTYLAAEPTVPPWATPTATLRPTFTPTSTPETWPTATVTRTPTRTATPTSTWTPLPTRTPWWTVTATPYLLPAGTSTPTPTHLPSQTPLPTRTHTPLPSTPTPTPTFTLIPTGTPTPTPTGTPSSTATRTPTPSPTRTPIPAYSPSPTSGGWSSPAPTHTRPPTSTLSPTPTHTPSPTETKTPVPSPSATNTPTPSPSSTHTPTSSPSPTLTSSPTPGPTVANTPSPVPDLAGLRATSLADNNVGLAWEPVAGAGAYRVYSDMGAGYGIYVFKTEIGGPELIDEYLRAGLRYRYRIGSVTALGETTLARADAVTPDRPGLLARDRSPVVDTGFAPQPVRSQSRVRVTPAPTPLPPDTVILGLLSTNDYAADVEDTLTIVGEVRNDSHIDVGETAVTATFYDTAGQVIGETGGATMLSALPPGVRSPFVITLPRPEGLENYSIRATGRPINLPLTGAGLNVVDTRRFEDTAGFYHIAGVVENLGQRRVEQARVVVTLYDRAGRVINVGFAYPQPASLSPNQRADFDVVFTYYPKVFSHLAIALGD